MKQWDENEHPRAPDGKFTNGHTLTPDISDIPLMEKSKGILGGDSGQEQSQPLNRSPKKGVQKYLSTFKGKPPGTYNYETGELVNLTNGYMVTFHCNEADENGHYKSHFGRYTEDEYDNLTNSFADENGAEVYIGTFDEEPEISFHIKDFDKARDLMIKYNQKSLWNWKAGKSYENPNYDPKGNPMRED